MIENASEKRRLVAKGCVKTGRVDTQQIGNICNADRIVTARMKKMLDSSDRLFRIKTPGTTAAPQFICSHYYKIP